MDHIQWLSQVNEQILEPARPICDPHHHLWEHPGSRYLTDELMLDVGSGHNVLSTVFVECGSMYHRQAEPDMAPIGETEFVEALLRSDTRGDIVKGIVGHANLSLGPDVRKVLDAHLQASPDRFCGIRHATAWNASDDIRNSHSNAPESLMLQDDFRKGMAILGEMGLSFDAWFYHNQLAEFVDLAMAFPNITMVLDHFGGPLGIGPYTADDTYKVWEDEIAALKDCHNVHFKLGGVNMKLNGFGWHQRKLPPTSDELVERNARYYEYCIKHFGAKRCMFESNFPVDKESCSYHVVWNAFKKIAANCSEAEKSDLFHDTAVRVYRIEASQS